MNDKKESSGVDIRQLGKESLAQKQFPGGQSTAFRIYLADGVHKDIAKHANESLEVEICGVLVGEWCKDERGPFVSALHSIRGDAAENRMAEVTFTHNTWSKINAEMDSKYPKLSIVGWYHTHPDFGIFLSDRDQFIQEHFFNGAGQIAYVVDPVRKTEGVFVWSQGKPTLTPAYWVGNEIKLSTAVGDEAKPRRAQSMSDKSENRPAMATAQAVPVSAAEPFFSAQNLLWIACLSLVFLMGYMIASMKTNWEQTRLFEGMIHHFARFNVLRPHLREVLDAMNNELTVASGELAQLKKDHETRAGEEGAAIHEKWESAQKRIRLVTSQVPNMQNMYCLPPAMEMEVVRAVNAAINQLNNMPKELGEPSKTPAVGDPKEEQKSEAKSPMSDEPKKSEEKKAPAPESLQQQPKSEQKQTPPVETKDKKG